MPPADCFAAGGPVSITEFAHSTVYREGWSFLGWHPYDGQVTPQESADYLTQDLVIYARMGFKDAMVYQINSGQPHASRVGDGDGFRYNPPQDRARPGIVRDSAIACTAQSRNRVVGAIHD